MAAVVPRCGDDDEGFALRLGPEPLGTSPSPCDAVVFGDESAVAARLWPR